MVRPEQRAHLLGIHALGARGEADEVGEEDGDDLALLSRDASGCGVSGAAQNGQNGNSPGSSVPHEGQVGTREVYGGLLQATASRAPTVMRRRSSDIPELSRMRGIPAESEIVGSES